MPRKTKQETAEMTIKPAEDKIFKLGEQELAMIKPNRGRKATPSRYLPEVEQAAKEPGVAYGIELYEGYDLTGTQVISELRKAAKQAGVKLQTFDRSKETPSFIGYAVKEEPVEASDAA